MQVSKPQRASAAYVHENDPPPTPGSETRENC
jgi:hypothetical protein